MMIIITIDFQLKSDHIITPVLLIIQGGQKSYTKVVSVPRSKLITL